MYGLWCMLMPLLASQSRICITWDCVLQKSVSSWPMHAINTMCSKGNENHISNPVRVFDFILHDIILLLSYIYIYLFIYIYCKNFSPSNTRRCRKLIEACKILMFLLCGYWVTFVFLIIGLNLHNAIVKWYLSNVCWSQTWMVIPLRWLSQT